MTKLLLIVLAVFVCIVNGQIDSSKLLFPEDLEYQGAFKLQDLYGNGTYLGYSPGEIAYNPNGDNGKGTILCTSNPHQQYVAEFSIPEPIITQDMNDLKTGQYLKMWTDVTSGKKDSFPTATLGINVSNIFVYDTVLLFSLFKVYNVDGQNLFTQGASSLDFNNLQTQGMWHIGPHDTYQADWTVGYMAEIPEQWRNRFGFPILAGNSKCNNESGSWGPGFFGYNPFEYGDLTPDSTVFSTKIFMFFPYELKNENTFMIDSTVQTPYTDGVSTWLTRDGAFGAAFPMTSSGKSSVISFVFLGTYTPDFYGQPYDFPVKGVNMCASAENGDKGPHDPPYYISAWFYDPEDLLKVGNGQLDSWKPRPYATINLKPHFFSDCVPVGAVAFDKKNGRIFISELSDVEGYDLCPLIHVYSIRNYQSSTRVENKRPSTAMTPYERIPLPVGRAASVFLFDVSGKTLGTFKIQADGAGKKVLEQFRFSGVCLYKVKVGSEQFTGKLEALK